MTRLALFVVIAMAVTFHGPARANLGPAEMAALQFDQHPGASLPLDATFRDESGTVRPLGAYFGHSPVIVVLEYLHCTTLCGFVLQDLARSLSAVSATAGRDYQVAAISIDPRDGPAEARAARRQYLARYPATDAVGWHFLTGDASAIARIAAAEDSPFGVTTPTTNTPIPPVSWSPTPEGLVSRYLLGIEYRPLDLRLALGESADDVIAAAGKCAVAVVLSLRSPQGKLWPCDFRGVARGLRAATVLGIAIMVALLARRNRSG